MIAGAHDASAVKIAAHLARQRMAARGITFTAGTNAEKPDEATQRARAESHRRAAVRAITLAAEGGFTEFAPRCLRVKNTSGKIVPFRLNEAQAELHKTVRLQMETMGRVRIVVLKARQLGISTYIAGRAYYNIHRRTGQSGLIVAHENRASKNLHAMVRTFHDFNNPLMRPSARRSNAAELEFSGLRSKVSIATAKNLESGRSFTHQFFHGSEVAFWPNAGALMKGAMQGIHDVAGTDVWFESTAIGPTGHFYTACQAARKGEFSDYAFVFLPWMIDPTRVRTPPEGFEDNLNTEDRAYMALHELSVEQMAWRAAKISELRHLSGSDEESARIIFGQEYPACPEDAFNASDSNSFISVAPVIRARRAMAQGLVTWESQEAIGAPKIFGIDPSWMGNDSFTVWMRQGRIAKRIGKWKHSEITTSVGRIIGLMQLHQPDFVNVDAVGVGAGVYDLLVEVLRTKSMNGMVFCAMAGKTAEEDERHVLVRDECWARTKNWLTNSPQVAITDDDSIQADLTSVRNKSDSHRRVRLESKDEMRKAPRSLPSPDDGDGLSLTFFMRDTGTHIGRAGVRSGGRPNPNRPFNYKTGVSH